MWMRWRYILFALFYFVLADASAQGPSPARNQLSILVLGDSLSAEYGLERGTGWVSIVAEQMQANGQEYQIHNASISGDTTSGGLARLPAALQLYKPDIVIIELGSNDALRGLALDMTENNLSEMVTLSKRAGARVLLLGMQIPPNYGRKYSDQFREIFTNVAEKHSVELVPFLLEGIAADKTMFQSDGIHPNEQAQRSLAANVWKVLEPMLAR